MDFSYLASLTLPLPLLIALACLCSIALSLLLKRFILARIQRWVSRTPFMLDSLLLQSLNVPFTLFVLIANAILLKNILLYFEYSIDSFAALFNKFNLVLFIVALVMFINSFCSGAIKQYAQRSAALHDSQGILQGVVRVLILSLGLLVLLGTLGIAITPIVASLGITSLAVALALQPTLENFFSGVQLVIDKPIRVGDYIELESGEQGFVDKIGWRSTWIKMLPNNTVIIPNSSLSNSKIINYFYPEKELSVPVEVSVHYSSDLEHVERVTLEVAREILKTHKWGVASYDTFVLFHTFADSSINFTVMLRAQEYFNRFFIKSAFIKALHKRFAEEGIVIPYPIRAINTTQENNTMKENASHQPP